MTSYTDLSPLSSDLSLGGPRSEVSPRPAARVVGSRLRPPRGLLPRGTIHEAAFGGTVPHNKGRTHAQKMGLRYEQKVHDVLSAIYGGEYKSSPSILYRDDSGLRRAIPDGLLFLGNICLVVEIKYSHTERAFWQLAKLYAPLLRRILVGFEIRLVEIVHTYDPDVILPGAHKTIPSLHKSYPALMNVWTLPL